MFEALNCLQVFDYLLQNPTLYSTSKTETIQYPTACGSECPRQSLCFDEKIHTQL